VFCGSKKSLVTGIPMANALFVGPSIGLVVLPLMIFHQLQLMASAALARRYALGGTVHEHVPGTLTPVASTTGPPP
jgi:predicted Na+-dependent transporter